MRSTTRSPGSATALALLLLLVLGLGACDEDPSPTTVPPVAAGRLSGAVYQRLFPEVPLVGAAVSWGAYATATDNEGRYELEPSLAGADTLRVSYPDFVAEARWVEVADTDAIHSFALMPFDIVPPAAPLAFMASSVEGTYLRLSWTPPVDADDVDGYWLRKSPGDPSTVRVEEEETSWVDIAVSSSREYRYELSSMDASGNLSPALVATGQVNGLPQTSRLELLPDAAFDRIPLSWRANPDEDFAAYRIYRSDGSGVDSTDLLVHEGSAALDTTFTDFDVSANTLYSYRLYTYDASGQAVTHNTAGQVSGAAQRFLAIDGSEKRALPLPGSASFLAASSIQPSVFRVDADGTVIETLALSKAILYLLEFSDGRICGYRPYSGSDPAYLVILQGEPLSLLAEGELDYGLSTLTWVGGDSLLVLPITGGVPRVVSATDFSALGTLDLLDLPPGSGLVADAAARQLFITENGGDRRLLRVDLSGAPALSAAYDLPNSAHTLQRAQDGRLLLAIPDSDEILRIDPADFGDVATIVLPTVGEFGRFGFQGESFWLRPNYANRVDGYALDWGTESATPIAEFAQITTPRFAAPLDVGGRILTTLSNGWISLCDPAGARQ